MTATQPLDGTLPSATPLPVDATLLFKSLQYQLLVAVEYCHDLEPDECVWLELFGDVTVPGKAQVEVKNYSDSLTDSHSNFWNTLKNWLHEKFQRTSYKRLVLLTTQEFGAQSQLKDWNTQTPAERLALMERISSAAQANARKRAAKQAEDGSDSAAPSQSQSLQQFVMADERRGALMEILERMQIITGAHTLEERLYQYQTRHLKAIRPSKCQQFIDDLLGFMWSTELVNTGWKITHQAFTNKISELTQRHMRHPPTFPPVDLATLKKAIDIEEIRPLRFAQKIEEIGGESYLKKAALHRLVAQTTISELYSDGVLFKSNVDLYLGNHRTRHHSGRNRAMLDCQGVSCEAELKKRSVQFYLERNDMAVEKFCGLENTMTEFRNGIYHLLAEEPPDDEDEEFHWRLWQ